MRDDDGITASAAPCAVALSAATRHRGRQSNSDVAAAHSGLIVVTQRRCAGRRKKGRKSIRPLHARLSTLLLSSVPSPHAVPYTQQGGALLCTAVQRCRKSACRLLLLLPELRSACLPLWPLREAAAAAASADTACFTCKPLLANCLHPQSFATTILPSSPSTGLLLLACGLLATLKAA